MLRSVDVRSVLKDGSVGVSTSFFCFTPPSRDRLWRLPHPFAPQQLATALSKLLSNDSKLLAH